MVVIFHVVLNDFVVLQLGLSLGTSLSSWSYFLSVCLLLQIWCLVRAILLSSFTRFFGIPLVSVGSIFLFFGRPDGAFVTVSPLFTVDVVSLDDLLQVIAVFQGLEELLLRQVVKVHHSSSDPLAEVHELIVLLFFCDRLHSDPFGHFPFLGQAVVDASVVFQAWSLLPDQFHSSFFTFPLVHFLVHLVEQNELFGRSRHHLIDLFVSRNFRLFHVGFLVVFLVAGPEEFFELLLPIDVAGVVIEHTRLNDFVVQAFLVCCLLQNALLDFRCGNKSINADFMPLTDSVGTIFSLFVHLRVPIRVKDDDGVRNLEIQAETTSFSREDEDFLGGVLLRKPFEACRSILVLCTAIENQVWDLPVNEIELHDVNELRELAEYQDLVTGLDHFRQHAIEELELARNIENVICEFGGLMALEQIGMITDFSELHDGVFQGDLGLLPRRIHHELVVLLNTLVDQFLLRRELDLNDHLNFLGQLFGHLNFESSQQKRPQNLMQSVDDQ